MRRGGYNSSANNQSGSILHNHNGPHHGHHQSQNRMGPNRMYQQQQQHHQTLQTLQTLQNLQSQQQQQQPQQLLAYGGHNSHHNPRPLSFPSPPLTASNLSLNSNHQPHHYPTGGSGSGSGGSGCGLVGSAGLALNSLANCVNYSGPLSSITGSNLPSSAVLGGDMPPVETVVARLETACKLLHGIGGNNTKVNEIGSEIQILSEDLRRVGAILETAYPDVLDRVMSSLRDASSLPSLPPSLRLAIFELVELRASKWMLPSDSSNYYRQRRNINESVDSPSSEGLTSHHHYNNSNPSSSSRINTISIPKPEVIFPSDRSPPIGTSPIPSNSTTSETSNNAKAYREEVIIKNSDSGKVAPTAKERVLSINGYSQQSINMAKQLIQDTIQRNSSPVFDGLVNATGSEYSGDGDDLDPTIISKISNSGKSENVQKFSYSVSLGDDIIRVTGGNLQFVQEAKFALDDYFSQKYPELFYVNNEIEDEDEISDNQTALSKYDRTTLLSLALVKNPIPNFNHLEPEVRSVIILEKPKMFDPEKFCKEMSNQFEGV